MNDDTKADAMRGVFAWSGVFAAKAVGAAHSLGISTWGEAASAASFAFTGLLILGWLYRYIGRPAWLWIRRGHERRRKARRTQRP